MHCSKDPFVQLTLGAWVETTPTLDNAGGDATWTNLDMVAEVTKEQLADEVFEVQVKDENLSRGDSLLGIGQISVRRLCQRINSEVTLEVTLVNERQATAGILLITAILSEARLLDMTDNIPDSRITLEQGLLCIHQVDAFDLKGGDLLTKPVSFKRCVQCYLLCMATGC